jgi:hypothetical protein
VGAQLGVGARGPDLAIGRVAESAVIGVLVNIDDRLGDRGGRGGSGGETGRDQGGGSGKEELATRQRAG